MIYTKKNIHISTIRSGDTIEHNGRLMTVCGKDIKNDPFMGTTIFGDSYRSGHSPVVLACIFHAKPEISQAKNF